MYLDVITDGENITEVDGNDADSDCEALEYIQGGLEGLKIRTISSQNILKL